MIGAGIDDRSCYNEQNGGALTIAKAAASQMVCHECDLLNDVPVLDAGQKAFCPCCGYLLAANRPNAQSTILVFSMTALLFLALANAFPFLGFSTRGHEQTVTLLQSVAILITKHYPELALVVFALIIAIPAVLLLAIIYVSTSIAINRRLPGIRKTLRGALLLMPWSMAEIFLIGILVSFVKIMSLADVTLGLSFWAYTLFTICSVVVMLHIDRRELWRNIKALTDA